MRAWRSAKCAFSSFEARRPLSTSIADLLRRNAESDAVKVNGWIRSVRKQKRVAFAAVGDGSTIDSLQAVLKPEQAAEYVSK
jgi:asparaginyl-tRNA synthetase